MYQYDAHTINTRNAVIASSIAMVKKLVGRQRCVLGRALESARGDSIQPTGDSVLDCARDPQPHPELC
jgi:hypothetical protein